MTNLSVKQFSKSFNKLEGRVVDGVSLELPAQHILAILGPSGCGKTTLLRMLAGFDQSDHGSVLLNEADITTLPPQKRKIGMVFQDYALFPHMTAFENITFGLKELPKQERAQRTAEVLELLELTDLAERLPSALSGGQQQRVALARSLAPRPEVLLLDEPFSSLDGKLRQSTCLEMRNLLKKVQMSVVLVTHDREEALNFADEIAIMNKGKIVQCGTPETIYYQPKTRFVANFFGMTNLFCGDAEQGQAQTPLGKVTVQGEQQGHVLIMLRPEQLSIGACDSKTENCAQVQAYEFKGCHALYHVLLGEQVYYVQCSAAAPHFAIGASVKITVLAPGRVVEDEVC